MAPAKKTPEQTRKLLREAREELEKAQEPLLEQLARCTGPETPWMMAAAGRDDAAVAHAERGAQRAELLERRGDRVAAALGAGWLASARLRRGEFAECLPALLTAYGTPPADGSAAYFGWDSPYTLGPNAGFFVLRGGEGAMAMLRTWRRRTAHRGAPPAHDSAPACPERRLAVARAVPLRPAARLRVAGGTSTLASTGWSTRTSSTRCSGA